MGKNIFSSLKQTTFIQHETKRFVFIKFLLVVGIVAAYFTITAYQYGIEAGFAITGLTWSFFVFCTPVADAGFLLDFPLRLITGIRMICTEIGVWITAFTINVIALSTMPEIYQTTIILRLFSQILYHPFPYWAIIVLSAAGTFFSVYFGDELIDVSRHRHKKKYHKHKNKRRIVVIFFIVVGIILTYYSLLSGLGITL